MADAIESVANEAEGPLERYFPVEGYNDFYWKFPTKEELEQFQAQMRLDLQTKCKELLLLAPPSNICDTNTSSDPHRTQPELDELADNVFRFNHGGVHGYEQVWNWDKIFVLALSGFLLLDKSLIDRSFIVLLDCQGEQNESSESKWLFEKYDYIIRNSLGLGEGFHLDRGDMKGWSVFFFTTLLFNTLSMCRDHWVGSLRPEPISIRKSIQDYIDSFGRSIVKEPESWHFRKNFLDLTNESGWRNSSLLTESIVFAIFVLLDVDKIFGHPERQIMATQEEIVLSTIQMKELEVGFIESGWFKFKTTTFIDEHLQFDGAT
jgi:hypothetical protein